MKTSPLLIVLFPEEACSPADKIWGEKEAEFFRRKLGDAVHRWSDSAWVITGPNAHELDQSGMFGVHIAGVTNKIRRANPHTRFLQGIQTHVSKVEEVIYNLKKLLRPFRLDKSIPVTLMGAWHSDKNNASLNQLQSALEQFGYMVVLGPTLSNPYDDDQEDREPVYEDVDETPTAMIVVHPGSACGSATAHLGRAAADSSRQSMVQSIEHHTGALFIVDGDLSDELPDYPKLNAAILNGLKKTKTSGRIYACDDMTPNWPEVVKKYIAEQNIPKNTFFNLTGAWYFEDDSAGCINAVYDVLRSLGFGVDVLDSALKDTDGDIDYEAA